MARLKGTGNILAASAAQLRMNLRIIILQI
jgi:hypothetical protein